MEDAAAEVVRTLVARHGVVGMPPFCVFTSQAIGCYDKTAACNLMGTRGGFSMRCTDVCDTPLLEGVLAQAVAGDGEA